MEGEVGEYGWRPESRTSAGQEKGGQASEGFNDDMA